MKYLEDKRMRSFLLIGVILVAFAFLFIKYDGFMRAVDKLINVAKPVIIGGFIAFALKKPLDMISKRYEKIYDNIYKAKLEKIKRQNRGVLPDELPPRSTLPFKLSIVTVYICVILFLALLMVIIVPQVAKSIGDFSENFDVYYRNIESIVNKYYKNNDDTIAKWIEELDILPKLYSLSSHIPTILMKTFGATANFVGSVIDIVLGVILSVYIMAEKNHLSEQGKKLGKRFCKPDKYALITKYLNLISDKFSSFISGQLTEAFVLGVMCFIGMTVLGFDYALLISVIIGLTNLIPIVGPIIGTIPGAIILLLANPKDAIWFVVFVIILQQIESNLIYPKVVGNSMGLPSLWVSVAVIVGGGLQGVFGMIVAIPLMSVVYTVLKEEVEKPNPASSGESS